MSTPPAAAPPEQAALEIDAAQQAAMVASLFEALRATDGGATRIETHISFVLVAQGMAYKIRKAVDLGFVDFTTLEQRRHDCEEELRLNLRWAPELYLDVLPLTGPAADPALGGSGPVLDWALRMRAFAQEDVWDRLAARAALSPQHIDELATRLCDFHRRAAVEPAGGPFGRAERVRAPVRDTLSVLAHLCQEPEAQASLSLLRRWETLAYGRLQGRFDARQREGRVRECHGDLHLANVAQFNEQTTMFDGLEFDPALRWTDVMSDVAFMAMDLHAHALPGLAHRFVNACVEASGDVKGLRVLRYYAVYRALVRAKVAAMRDAADGGAGDATRRYLTLALALRRPAAPVLILTHGCSGSGKTLFTQSLLELTGAVRLRADIERKRLFGLPALARSPQPVKERLYSSGAHEATYERLRAQAAVALDCGFAVILDATFLDRAERQRARLMAEAAGATFVIVDFQARDDTLRARVQQRAQRGDDASDADVAVLEAQLSHRQPLQDDERDAVQVFDAEPAFDPARVDERWAALLQRLNRRAQAGGKAGT